MASIELMDLPMDILIIIFRVFIPLKEKLRLLCSMPELHHVLTYRGAYLFSPGPFSPAYLHYLSGIRPGWYFARRNWTHLFCLRIDKKNLNFALHHFFLEGFEGNYKPSVNHRHFFRGSIDRMFQNVESFLTSFEYLEEEEEEANAASMPPPPRFLFYSLAGYGLILIDQRHPSPLDGLYNMRFYDWSDLKIRIGRRQKILCRWRLEAHFRIRWKANRTLIVQCLTPNLYYCHCETRIQKLSPITYRASPDLSALIWSEGNSVPLVGRQEFRLAEDEKHVESNMTYHVNYQFYNSLEVEVIARRNEAIRKSLE